jgi:hypothetical protein
VSLRLHRDPTPGGSSAGRWMIAGQPLRVLAGHDGWHLEADILAARRAVTGTRSVPGHRDRQITGMMASDAAAWLGRNGLYHACFATRAQALEHLAAVLAQSRPPWVKPENGQ